MPQKKKNITNKLNPVYTCIYINILIIVYIYTYEKDMLFDHSIEAQTPSKSALFRTLTSAPALKHKIGASEHGVPLNPLVYPHFLIKMAKADALIFRHSHMVSVFFPTCQVRVVRF